MKIATLGRVADIAISKDNRIATFYIRDENSEYIVETRKIEKTEDSTDKGKVYLLGEVIDSITT